MKKLPSPKDINYGVKPAQVHAINFVHDKLINHDFTFEVPYQYQQWSAEVRTALKEAGWGIIEHKNPTRWEIRPN